MSGILLLVLRIILVLVLYIFVGWALLILWRDLRQQSAILRRRDIPQIGLYPQAETNLLPVSFNTPDILIGRDPSADLVVSDPTISSRQARLYFQQEQWWVEDLNSTNGTRLNDQIIDTPTVITHGDHLMLGQIEFLVTIDLLKAQES